VTDSSVIATMKNAKTSSVVTARSAVRHRHGPARATVVKGTLFTGTVLVSALLSGCGRTDDSVAVNADSPPLTVTVRTGGSMMFGADVASSALLHLHEGKLYRTGATTAEYPGPLLSPMEVSSLSDEQSESLVKRLTELKLLGPSINLGPGSAADAPTTTITINNDGKIYTHSFTNLGMVDEQGHSLGGADLTAEQRTIQDGVWQWLSDPLGAGESSRTPAELVRYSAYQFAAVEITEDDLAAISGLSSQDGSLDTTITPWPLTGQLARGALLTIPCVDVVAEDAATLGPVLKKANQRTYFTDNGRTFRVFVRGALPGEAPCPTI
jgi:hypothetical protein